MIDSITRDLFKIFQAENDIYRDKFKDLDEVVQWIKTNLRVTDVFDDWQLDDYIVDNGYEKPENEMEK